MDLTAFVHAQRQEGLLLGDYSAYRSMCSRRLATLRKRLGRSNAKRYAQQPALTPENIAKDPSHAQLLLLAAERAWAHAMHLKSLIAEDPTAATGALKSHLISRFHKASTHASTLAALLADPVSAASPIDLLESAAYASTLRGVEAFDRTQWEASLRSFAVARSIYSVLLAANKAEAYAEQLSSTVDPSVRYAAYQLQLPRSLDISAIARQYFPRAEQPQVVAALEALDPAVFAEQMEVDSEAASVGAATVTWRGRTAAVEDAAISIALSDAQAAENAYNAHDQLGSTDAFDGVLLAWQDAADAVRKSIDERAADGMSISHPTMQLLQLTKTAINYALVSWRVGRNRVMIANIVTAKKPAKNAAGVVYHDARAPDHAPDPRPGRSPGL